MNIQEWIQKESGHLTLALVFTDIVGSTILQSQAGDQVYLAIKRDHFARARHLIETHSGFEIKTAGDSFLVAFMTAVAALDFAVALYDDPGDDRLRIRAGIHVGPVRIEDDRDIFGTSVNYTSRVMNAAPMKGAVMLSRDAKSHIELEKNMAQLLVRFDPRQVKLAGFEGKQQIYLTISPRERAAKRKRANEQNLASKIFFGPHERG